MESSKACLVDFSLFLEFWIENDDFRSATQPQLVVDVAQCCGVVESFSLPTTSPLPVRKFSETGVDAPPRYRKFGKRGCSEKEIKILIHVVAKTLDCLKFLLPDFSANWRPARLEVSKFRRPVFMFSHSGKWLV